MWYIYTVESSIIHLLPLLQAPRNLSRTSSPSRPRPAGAARCRRGAEPQAAAPFKGRGTAGAPGWKGSTITAYAISKDVHVSSPPKKKFHPN